MLSQGETLIGAGATWNYLDDGTDQGTAWRDPVFEDGSWESGPAELGYGDGDEATVISYGADPNDKYPCYYFRHSFDVADPAVYESLMLEVIRDDGCVAYLNGSEVARSNMPEGEITYYTWSETVIGGDDPDEGTWHGFAADAALLVSGANVVAVEVHQCHATSSDLSFDLELSGVATIPTVALVSPADQSVLNNTQVSFTCSATDDVGLTDATLYVGGQSEMVTFSGSTDTDDAQLYATDDSSTPEVEGPNTNAGSAVAINVDGANPHAHAVIGFPNMFGDGPGQVPLGSTIVSASASLEVNCTNPGNPLQLYRLTEDWNEGEVTWNERASGVPWANAGADGTGSHAGVALDGYCTAVGTQTFDITPFVQEWSDGAANYGIVMTDSGNDGIDFDSSESVHPPLLTVTYGTPKEAIETKPLSGTSDTATFNTTLSDDGDYLWNCLVTNTSGQESWAPADFQLTVDTHCPDQPVVVAPADGATGVSTSPALEVAVSDPDGDPLDVTFYGTGDSAGEDFTIVVLPDTQKYAQSYPEIFTAQTQWIADNVDALNTVFVTHEGDIVETWDSTTEWERADTSMSLLDGVVPYGVLPGNHDQPTTYYNQYFPYTRYEAEPWYGSHYGDTNDNNYQLFSAGGDDYIIVHLEYAPSSEVITWADSVLETYVDRKAIITTHSYLNGDGSRTTPGNTIWNDLVVPNPNVYFVLCGHVADEYTRTDVVNGHNVYQLLADYQGDANGGNGWLRTMRFSPSEDTVYVETYSPWLDQFETDADSQFTLDFDMADFSVIGTETGVPSGSNASMVWSDLSMDVPYDWYVTVTDTSARTTTGPTWSFTTGLVPNDPPVANDDSYSVAEGATLTADDADGTVGDASDDGVAVNDTDPDLPDDTLTVNTTPISGPAYGSLTLNADGTFVYTHDGSENFTDSFTYELSDALGATDMATVSITITPVNDAPVLAPIGGQSVDEGSPLAFTAMATDSDLPPDTLTFSLSGAPAGAGITSGGDFSWTPSEDQGPGDFTFDVVVGDGSLSDSETITVTVNEVNVAPVLAAIGGQSVDEGSPLTFTATATDADLPANTLTFSLSGEPAGAGITSGGDFSWTPTEAQGPGMFTFDVVVSDGSLSDSETIMVTVGEVNVAPVLAAIGEQNVDEGTPLTFTATATDADLPANSLTFSLSGEPPGASITSGGDFSWTPTETQGPGDFTFDVLVSDGSLSDGETITVTVNEANIAPVLGPIGNKSVDEGSELTFTATATDSDSPPDELTFSLGAGSPAGASIDPSSGLFTWTPSEAEGPGDYQVIVQVTDDGSPPLGDSEMITVTVGEVNTAPVLGAIGDKSVAEGTELTFTATATDADLPANSLTFSLDAGAPEGASINASTGVFTWTPTEAQGPGSYQVTVRVSDDATPSLTDSETITITVNEVNDAPVASDDAASTVEDTPVNVDVLANDTDAENDPLTIIILSATDGTAVVNNNGTPEDPSDDTVDFTPAPGFTGEAGFSYKVNDGELDSNVAMVSVTVTPAGPVIIAADGFESGDFLGGSGWLETEWTYSGVAEVTSDGGPVEGLYHALLRKNNGYLERSADLSNYSSVQLSFNFSSKVESFEPGDEANVKVSSDGVTWEIVQTFTADSAYGDQSVDLASYAGTSRFYIAFDAGMDNPKDYWYIDDVELEGIPSQGGQNRPPLANDDAAMTAQDTAVEIDVLANDADPDNDPLSVESVTQGSYGSVVINADNTVTYSPNVGSLGMDFFSYTISDGQGGTDTATVNVTVGEATATKFFVVDGGVDDTFQYDADGNLVVSTGLAPGNLDPRGAASNAAGTRVWVVDRSKVVYVYDNNGNSLGSWTAGGLGTPEGIATDGTDIWIVDARQDQVFCYTGAASLTSGSQDADLGRSFALDGSNGKAKGITTDGASIWVVNDNKVDTVFKYDVSSGGLLGSWTIEAANSKPTGITIDPNDVSDVWIVDSGKDQIFVYSAAAGLTSGSQTADAVFHLTAENTNPQGIADPPAGLSWGTGGYVSPPLIDLPGGIPTSEAAGGEDSRADDLMLLFLEESDPAPVARYSATTRACQSLQPRLVDQVLADFDHRARDDESSKESDLDLDADLLNGQLLDELVLVR